MKWWILSALIAGCTGEGSDLPEGASEEECSDGEDNDADGQTDCEDPGCYTYSICQGAPDDTGADDTGDTGDTGPVYEDESVCINEFMASNATTLADPDGLYSDWIELHNAGDTTVDLSGYWITDDLDNPDQHELPAGTAIPAGGYLILWADSGASGGDDSLGFALSADGEELGLYRPDGSALQKLEYASQASDRSASRKGDCSTNWCITAEPTPEGANGEPLEDDTCSE